MKDLETIAFAQKELDTPFAWGTNDCNTLVLKYLDEVWGNDVLSMIYGKYKTKIGAVKFNKKQKYTFTDGIVEELGAIRLPPKLARTGDILIVHTKGFEMGHICLGTKILSVIEDCKTSITRIDGFDFFNWALRIN